MDYPFIRGKTAVVAVNRLPDNKQKDQRRDYPLISYLQRISDKDKFRFLVIIIIAILFFYRVNLHSSIWLGLGVGIIIVYYIQQQESQQVNNKADNLWNTVNSNLLSKTKYFISDPQLIEFIGNVGDLKKYNILQFNQLVKSLDTMLKAQYDLKRGINSASCKLTYDVFVDNKVASLNNFHSLIYKLPFDGLRDKYNKYLSLLGKLLNDRHNQVIDICRNYYDNIQIGTDSAMFDFTLDDPVPNDTTYNFNFNFFN